MAKECKYYKQKKQVSFDGGQTWQDVVPAEYQKGALYEQQSTDCGYVPPVTQYRWVKTNDTTCIENPEPPTPTGKKLVAQYYGGLTREVECNGDDTLRTGETRPYNWEFSGMTSAVIGNCVTSIDNRAFYYYFYEFSGLPHLSFVTIPDSVTTIGNGAFSHCYKLISAPIPNSVTSIGYSAFNKCKKLESINIPSGITSIGDYAFSGCVSAGGSIVIPNSLTSLGSAAFWGCHSLVSVTIGSGLTTIGNQAFKGCSGLTNVTIGGGIANIGDDAFIDCYSLTSITINATTPPTLGSNVFEYTNDCPILVPCESVSAYKSATNWSTYASRIQGIPPCEPDPQYRWVNMDASVDYYCEGTTKYYKQKKQISLDDGQTWQDITPAEYQRGGVAEQQSTDCGYVPPTPVSKKLVATYTGGTTREVDCNDSTTLTTGETKPSGYVASAMTSAVIGDCVTSIGDSAFNACSGLTSVTIPNSVTFIDEDAFSYCRSLTSITIPSSVTTISGWAFNDCRSLTSITIPNSVTSIGSYAFDSCSGLTSVTVNATTPPTLGTNVFQSTNNCPIYVPCQSVDLFKSTTNWSTYADRIQGIPPCGEASKKLVANYSDGTTREVECNDSSTLTSGETKPSRYDYTIMTSAVIGDCVTTIGKRAFFQCSGLTSVTIPDSVAMINSYAFFRCFSLTSVTIPTNITGISEGTFEYCALTSVTIPSSVTYIGLDAFANCQGLKSITCLATTPPSLDENVFYNTCNCPIYVPAESVNAYKAAPRWFNYYSSRIQPIP